MRAWFVLLFTSLANGRMISYSENKVIKDICWPEFREFQCEIIYPCASLSCANRVRTFRHCAIHLSISLTPPSSLNRSVAPPRWWCSLLQCPSSCTATLCKSVTRRSCLFIICTHQHRLRSTVQQSLTFRNLRVICSTQCYLALKYEEAFMNYLELKWWGRIILFLARPPGHTDCQFYPPPPANFPSGEPYR